MALTRRNALAGMALLQPRLLQAQPAATAWPTRPVRIVCPFGAGGAGDTIARLLQPKMAEFLGQPVVIENRTGAGGTIGAITVARSPADGYALLLDSANHAVAPLLFRLPLDYPNAFTKIGLATIQPYVWCIGGAQTAGDVQDYVAQARAQSAPISYGTPGTGSTGHIAAEAFRQAAGLRLRHVPYRGGADAARDLASGALDAACITLASAAPVAQSGRFRILAQTGARRSGVAPEVPTIAEAGFPGCDVTSWTGLFAPAGIAPAIIHRANQALQHGLTDGPTRRGLLAAGFEPTGGSPEDFAVLVDRDREALGRIVRAAGMTIE